MPPLPPTVMNAGRVLAVLCCALASACLPGPSDRQYACNDDTQCAQGWRCNRDDGFCRRPCTGDIDCESGLVCRNNLCTASSVTTGSSSGTVAGTSGPDSGSAGSASGVLVSSTSSPPGSSTSASGMGGSSSSSGSGGTSSSSMGGSATVVLDAVTLAAGGMSNENNLNRVSLCVGQPVVGFEDATVSRISLGILGSITPEGEGTTP